LLDIATSQHVFDDIVAELSVLRSTSGAGMPSIGGAIAGGSGAGRALRSISKPHSAARCSLVRESVGMCRRERSARTEVEPP
jgi:hypothetical protein